MILFIFEGKKREPMLFDTMKRLFFREGQSITCSFNNNIYQLYQDLQEMDEGADIVSVLREKNKDKEDSPFNEDTRTSDFSEIYLFFDYDFQNKNLTLGEMNAQLKELLELFNDETDNGKLYINYPMIESIRYTKALPDLDFINYTITLSECQEKDFKEIAAEFSCYGNLDYIVLPTHREPTESEINKRKQNWIYLKEQNVSKANYICNGENNIPVDKSKISQERIFAAELEKYITPSESISILSAFPLFLHEYLKTE